MIENDVAKRLHFSFFRHNVNRSLVRKMHKYYFEKLRVWHDARALVNKVYTLTMAFPKEEEYHLKSQMRRAASSVKSNIAEGQGRKTKRDQLNFTYISYSSLIELLNHADTAFCQDYFTENNYFNLREDIDRIGVQLNALKRTQEEKISEVNLK